MACFAATTAHEKHIRYKDAMQIYIGTTKSSIQSRIKEHERHCRLKEPEKPEIAEHTMKQTRNEILFQDTDVLDNTTNHYVRLQGSY
ncbi:hypothetical protein JRQ81_010923 [Phrynocephalus forsythii]|uniref:Uncharacterized protein n=1 Tax=Phrynocephalus forsythii TaxID=171643 RepID=A0A9Q0Y0G6_9SAUR|nr:hypothetical protein JRQ81_010923 [Phrynocephalus forsythii]